jgi:CMP-N,N'-diacetyllegionaminic acid synthase
MTMGSDAEIITIITARGGSKGLKNKNILPFFGQPLIAWTIQASMQCPLISRTIISTDSENIAAIAYQYGAEVIQRPAELATDTSTSDEVIAHSLALLSPRSNDPIIALLQPTSPLRNSDHITSALELFLENPHNSVISVYVPKHSPIKSFIVDENQYLSGLYSASAPFQARQSLPQALQPNGAIYLFKMSEFRKNNMIPRDRIRPYIMPANISIDIDDKYDFDLAESIMESIKNGES